MKNYLKYILLFLILIIVVTYGVYFFSETPQKKHQDVYISLSDNMFLQFEPEVQETYNEYFSEIISLKNAEYDKEIKESIEKGTKGIETYRNYHIVEKRLVVNLYEAMIDELKNEEVDKNKIDLLFPAIERPITKKGYMVGDQQQYLAEVKQLVKEIENGDKSKIPELQKKSEEVIVVCFAKELADYVKFKERNDEYSMSIALLEMVLYFDGLDHRFNEQDSKYIMATKDADNLHTINTTKIINIMKAEFPKFENYLDEKIEQTLTGEEPEDDDN